MSTYKQTKEKQLHGRQHVLDKNKNNKIDAHDFELLRKEKDELSEAFTDEHLEKLRQSYGNISGIDPDSEHYEKLIKHLESMPKKHLEQLAAADIKFISPLAGNTLRNMKTENDGRKLQTDSVHYPSRLNEYVNAISKNHKFTDIKYMIENEQADDDPHHERFKKEADSYSAEEHEMAKRLHEDWRAGLSDREKDDPRERSKMGGPKRPINVDYDKLHPSAKLENLAAARAAIQAVRLHGDNKEAAAEHIHNEWMKRKDLHVPYNEWSEEEKEKDREHHRIASEILARRASVLNK